jgi:GABA permease
VVFIALGSLYVLGIWPDKSLDFSNLTSNGGFLPNGIGAVFTSIVVVIFSMVGAEIATIAAAESKDPARAIAKATNSVIVRIGIFFVGSVFLLAVILPWNSNELGSSPYVSAFTVMGIPYADQIMNAVVLTAVLSCLNSGMYTASRMLFVLAARREAPVSLITVNKRGVPTMAILSSSIVGFLCVIAAAVSPDTVFTFLLNSSGAIILFVYILIAVSELILRRRTPPEKLKVKMWFFPYLTIATIAAMVAVLVMMGFDPTSQSQLFLSLLAFAVVLVLYAITKWRGGSVGEDFVEAPPQTGGTRVLVLANETVGATELLDELRAIDNDRQAQYYVCVPANPVDTGQAEHNGAVWVWQETTRAAQARLDSTLEILRSEGLHAEGSLGEHRPLQALEKAVTEFKPDRIVISTHPEVRSAWLRHDVVDRARTDYPNIPVRHIVAVSQSVDAT